jgi:hypothetical protein
LGLVIVGGWDRTGLQFTVKVRVVVRGVPDAMAEIVTAEVPIGVPELTGGIALVAPGVQEINVRASAIARAIATAKFVSGDIVAWERNLLRGRCLRIRADGDAGGVGCTDCGSDSAWMWELVSVAYLVRVDCWRLGRM